METYSIVYELPCGRMEIRMGGEDTVSAKENADALVELLNQALLLPTRGSQIGALRRAARKLNQARKTE